jgi:predicted regulator of Ras-like GTPase activity (Roadblock/LC7/MglB family)
LTERWPDTIKQEIARLNLAEAQIALPTNLVESGLKRGRIAFPWKTLRSWIRPTPLPSISVNDSVELELPLSLVAPLFISRRKSASSASKSQQKTAVDETIPNLFFGFPQPETATSTAAAVAPAAAPVAATPVAPAPARIEFAPAAQPSDTNYFAVNDSADLAASHETEFKRAPAANTDFTSRKASPNEVIARAAALEGVVGTLIALPDGLKVASHIPADLNGDTLAAFLPQLFNKMSQCTRELRMGELNNLNFTVGNVPWKIFRVNAVFFAAFGRAGQPLPTAQLAALAGELDRKNK